VVLFILRTYHAERSRYAAEAQLRNSERDYRVLFESAIVPIVIFEPGGERILQANAAACELYGVAAGDLVGVSMKEFTKDVARGEEQIAELLRTGTCGRFESVHRRRDGREIDVLVSSSVIRYGGKKAILSFNRDITERKRAEERFSRAFSASPEPVTISALSDGTYIDVNQAFLRTTGYTREEVIGRTALDAKFWPTSDARARFLEELERGPVRDFEVTFGTKSGELRSGLLSGEIIEIGGQLCLLAITNDVTDRKRAEEALRESEDRYRDLVEHSHDLICTHDLAGRLLSVNQEPARILGYSPEELMKISMRDLLIPEVREQFDDYLEKIAQEGTAQGLLAVRTRSGETRIWEYQNTLRTEGVPEPIVRGMAHDVTDRKRAEKALRENEERFRSLVENATVGIYRTTPDGRIVMANPALVKMLGYDSFEALAARDLEQTGFEPNCARVEFKTRLDRDGIVRGLESAWRRNDGTTLFVRESARAIRDGGGQVLFYDGIIEDITERKRAEERIKESEEKFRKAFMTGADAYYIATLDGGKLIEVNDRFEDVFGFSREEAIGKTSLELGLYADPADRSKMVSEIKAQGYARNLELRGKRKSREPITILLSANILAGGGEPIILGVVRDISEQKRAQESLVRLRHAVDASGEVVFMTDRDGVITSINPEFTRLYGYSADEVVGKTTPRILKSGDKSPEEYARFWSTILDKKIARGDIVNKTRDGRLVTVESSVNPILDERGEIAGFLAIQRDISARKQLEEQFRQAQKMEAIGRLAGGVAHDFNNLLTIINGYGQLLLERFAEEEPVRAHLGEILKAGDRATALTRQLLAFSRRQVLEPKVLDLGSIVEGMQTMLRRLIGEDVELRASVRKPLGLVKADPTQVEQLILNLVVNARDAMPHGGKLTIETASAELDQTYAQSHSDVTPGHYVMLAVSDTGVGMDDETMAHIFEPFFTTKARGKGTGLGLSTVYGIVKQTRGHISVYSEPGRGTTFKVFLPQVAKFSEAAPTTVDSSRPLGGSETILLVEDEKALRGLAVSVLKEYGYHVLESETPQEAVEIGEDRQTRIDLLLTDVVMPGMSGRNIAEHLAFLRPEMKVLYMSGYTDDAIIHHGVLQAGVAFMQKPFTPEVLARKVREVLDMSQA
jgi:PAS domain S-box-containing protein